MRIASVLCAALVMTLARALPAQAQLIDGRPFRALFRTTDDPARSRDRIDLTAFLAGGHDEGELRDASGVLGGDPRLSRASFGSLFAAGLYGHEGRRSRFFVAAAGTARYYSASPIEALLPMNGFGTLRWTAPLGRRTSTVLSQRVQYSPYFAFRPSVAIPASDEGEYGGTAAQPMSEFDDPTDYRTTRRTTSSYISEARLNSRTGRNSRFELAYAFRLTNTTAEASDVVSHRPSARYTHSFTRNTAVSLGYTLNRVEYSDVPFGALVSHDIHGGLIYGRQLPFSRQTRVSFSTTSSVVVDGTSRRLHVGGVASLSHQFSRDWLGHLYYRRSAEVLEGFAVPFFTFVDGVTAHLGGRLGGPLRVSASGSYTQGSFSVSTLDNRFQSKAAAVRLWVPVTSMLATYVEGLYSKYDFQRRIGLLPTMPAFSTRYGVRAGLTFWLPILR